MRGDGKLYIRGSRIYVCGSINGVFFRKSTGKSVTPITRKWMKKADPIEVLQKLLDITQKYEKKVDFESFGYEVLELTSSRRKKASQDELVGIFTNRILPYFRRFRFEDIKPMDVVKFLNIQKKEVCNDRVRRVKNTLGVILDFAMEHGLIERNPVRTKSVSLVDLTYVPKNANAYTTMEIKLILSNAKGWFKVFLDLSFKLGLRTGECMALKWSDFNLENGALRLRRNITKGIITQNECNGKKNHCRDLQLFPDSLKLLRSFYEIRPSNEWLFINKDGTYFKESKTIVDYHLKPLLKEIGVEYKTLYATRRSYASVLYFGMAGLSEIQKNLGHQDGSKVTETHYIDPGILQQEHREMEAKKHEEIFNVMVKGVTSA